MANVFDTIRSKVGDRERSSQWYQNQVRKLGVINTNKLLKEGTLVNRVLPGEMYMFFYDPKTKEKLPYYDRFPLVLPFRRIENGFVGLNLHYLPYMIRFRILGYLSDFTNNEKMDETTRVRLSWNLLEGSSKLAPVKACVRKYLLDHVESRFLKIPFPDWVIASQLPVENFEKAEKATIWRDSRKKY